MQQNGRLYLEIYGQRLWIIACQQNINGQKGHNVGRNVKVEKRTCSDGVSERDETIMCSMWLQ